MYIKPEELISILEGEITLPEAEIIPFKRDE